MNIFYTTLFFFISISVNLHAALSWNHINNLVRVVDIDPIDGNLDVTEALYTFNPSSAHGIELRRHNENGQRSAFGKTVEDVTPNGVAVPEPNSLLLLAASILYILSRRNRKFLYQ